MYSIELKIPKARVAVLIGRKGSMKKFLESKLGVRLRVSREGDVLIIGESLNNLIAQRVVKAIGRGFNPSIALNLMRDDYNFEVIDMRNFTGKSKSALFRIRSRIIGTKGKAWKNMESLCHVDIAVHGHTVAVIGEIADADLARLAIEKLMGGSSHGNVYEYIDKQRKRIDQELY